MGEDGEVRLERIVINDSNAQQILKSPAVQGELLARANAIAAAAAGNAGSGASFTVSPRMWGARAAVFVTTGNTEARKAEAADRSLTRALDAGR